MNDRPRPIRETEARLIYQHWAHQMNSIGRGNEVFAWEFIPGDVRQTFEDAVSSVINWTLRNIVKGLADRLGVPVETLIDRLPEP